MRAILLGLTFLAGLAGATLASRAEAQTLDAVRSRGELHCGTFGGLPGFSAPDEQGVIRGIDADICRAIAAAVLGDAEKVRFVLSDSPTAGLAGIEAGQVDVLVRNSTVTALRDVGRQLSPTAIYFYDGQGLLLRQDAGINYLRDMEGKRICVASPEVNTSAANLRDAARRAGVSVTPVELPRGGAALFAALREGHCDAISADAAGLATLRLTELPNPDDYVVLPERLSREPLTAWVRSGDAKWRQLVSWTIHALIAAEELGLESSNLEEHFQSESLEVRLLLGLDRGLGEALGLQDTWALEAIRQVGNYGEIYARNLGEGSPLGLDRGLNDLWRQGGLLYPYPFR